MELKTKVLQMNLYCQCDLAVGILWCNSPVYVHQSKSLIRGPSERLSFTAHGKPRTRALIMRPPLLLAVADLPYNVSPIQRGLFGYVEVLFR